MLKLAPPSAEKRKEYIRAVLAIYVYAGMYHCACVCVYGVCVCALIKCNWRESVAVIMVIWQVFTLRLELGVTVICLNKENSCKKKSEADEEEEEEAGGEAAGETEGGVVQAMKLIYIRRCREGRELRQERGGAAAEVRRKKSKISEAPKHM